MQAEGLPYGERSMTYNSRLAQELAAWAVTLPQGDAIHNALFQAYFVDGVNLADPDELLAIATRRGLPTDEAVEVITTRSFREAVERDWQRSRDLGITGVPTFVYNGRQLVGAQPYEALEQLVMTA